MRKKISSKISVLVVSQILRLFVNILTPDDKHSSLVKPRVYRNQFKCNYLQIEKYFLIFFYIFGIYIKFEIIWKKRWASGGYLFLKL